MKQFTAPAMIIGSIMLVVIIAVINNSKKNPVEPPPTVQHANAASSSQTQAPSKDNVDHSFVQTVEELKKSVSKDPRKAEHLIALATLLMDGHRPADAIPYLTQTARLKPGDEAVLLDLSVCYSMVEKHDSAMIVTDRVLKLNPKNLKAMYNKGALLATLGKPAEAAHVWRKIRTDAPTSEEAKKAEAGLNAIGK